MCPECYSEFSRITPLINPEECLKNHPQYICQTCGRHICAFRGLYPFKTLEIAKLYLRSAEAKKGKQCRIYEFDAFYPNMVKSRKLYKIFADKQEVEEYLKKSSNKRATSDHPQFIAKVYNYCSEKQLRKLTSKEIKTYLKEQKEQSEEWRDFLSDKDI